MLNSKGDNCTHPTEIKESELKTLKILCWGECEATGSLICGWQGVSYLEGLRKIC